MRCAKSEVDCVVCQRNPDCEVYSIHYVLKKELKKLCKALEDALVIVKSTIR